MPDCAAAGANGAWYSFFFYVPAIKCLAWVAGADKPVYIFKPPLGLRPTPPAKVELHSDFANLKPDKAAQKILGLLMNNAEAITASGSLDVLRYGRVLRSRMLVGVRGAGLAYDGLYYVDSVTHNIKRGEYKQSFSLSRDGLISNTPRVPP